jgi:AGZA family xanthine/uracil permease-like MFS transporter
LLFKKRYYEGSTPVIVYVESAAGINEGGKTGLTAIVVGCLFFMSTFLAPLFSEVPATATAPVAILIGVACLSKFNLF